MRGGRYSVVWVLALLMLTGFAGMPPTAAAAMNLPTWSPGDFWEYEISGEVSPTGGEGRMRIVVEGTDAVTVGGVTYSAYRTQMTFNVTFGGFSLSVPGNAWYRVSDLSQVKMDFTMTITILNLTMTTTMTMTSDPPPEIRWPLQEGAEWQVSSTVNVTTETTGTPPETITTVLSGQAVVEADVNVSVPAGTFTTTPVRKSDLGGGFTKSYWSSQVGNSVREESFDSAGTQMGSMDLTSYSYTAPSGELTFLGQPLLVWIIIGVVIVAAAVFVIVLRGRKPPMPATTPPAPPSPPAAEPGPPERPPGSSP